MIVPFVLCMRVVFDRGFTHWLSLLWLSQVTAATHWLVGPVWDNLRSPSAVKARTALTDLNGTMATLHESGQTLDEVIQARFSID